MISELSILDIIDVADAAEKTDVAGLVPPSGISSISPGVYTGESDMAIVAGEGITVRSVYDDITTNINIDEADIRKLKANSAEFNDDIEVHGSANLASAYLTGDLDVYGCVNLNGPTTINSVSAGYLTVNTQLDVCGYMRVQNQLMIETYGDLRYNRDYQDRSVIDDLVQVRNDVDYLMGSHNMNNNDIYNHPAVITLQNQIAELNTTVAALRQMLP